MRIYLAGDMDDWREDIKREAPGHYYLDPTEHFHLKQEDVYTFLDLEQVRMADLVVARADPANPSIYGTSFEMGYARGLGIPVLLIDELTSNCDPRAHYFGMARSAAQVTVQSVDQAIRFLRALPR